MLAVNNAKIFVKKLIFLNPVAFSKRRTVFTDIMETLLIRYDVTLKNSIFYMDLFGFEIVILLEKPIMGNYTKNCIFF